MKLWLFDRVATYEEFDAVVVVAETAEGAREALSGPALGDFPDDSFAESRKERLPEQFARVEPVEVPMDRPVVVVASFVGS